MNRIGSSGPAWSGRRWRDGSPRSGTTSWSGARSRDSASLAAFADDDGIETGSFEDAAAFGDLVVNATNGGQLGGSARARPARANLAGKPVIDLTNDLEPVEGGYPSPRASADNSLGQRLQAAFPDARVVKSLNTMNCAGDGRPVPRRRATTSCSCRGDDAGAKDTVRRGPRAPRVARRPDGRPRWHRDGRRDRDDDERLDAGAGSLAAWTRRRSTGRSTPADCGLDFWRVARKTGGSSRKPGR